MGLSAAASYCTAILGSSMTCQRHPAVRHLCATEALGGLQVCVLHPPASDSMNPSGVIGRFWYIPW
ncbi:hypothetical protein COCSUDRAFT_33609 [Coccomyxa subellipsoidea C-169]|uniref:Uncharacterized protein n=1 Tax=Coccomyxa subellipsoidea (strain C-169) TaxID=574566 RepID=I0YUC6_COCSC|nr:hypothetical protein COCSUDRAFT_33609 [Coccomyxa subellipsoidea C-169]EIE21995.1 hypothetical protein COCSUDRAFT_33609 [Coccomyxa subellipsoidea C-169]|eukprot:XP_005646539.1 hypothetical protein COCSUDRAFT_33609 [Coccomyxa subellipsoidea C-169]